jgi:tetratricopeptide (TPR) repeat protein
METTWKEQKHNSAYLLGRKPDYIVFSTGIKPSAPAERALLLYRYFMDCYRTVGWHYQNKELGGRGVIVSSFQRMCDPDPDEEIVPVYPVEYVQRYKEGLDNHSRNNHREAVRSYNEALEASPDPPFIYVVYQRAFSLLMLNQIDQARMIMDSVLLRDSTVFEAHKDLYIIARLERDEQKAETHRRWLNKLVPWYFPRIKTLADQQVARGTRLPR